MVPESGRKMSMMSRNNVVFPAPLGPKRPKISPRCTSNEASSTATTARKAFLTECSAMAGEGSSIGLTTGSQERIGGCLERLVLRSLTTETAGWPQRRRHLRSGKTDSSQDQSHPTQKQGSRPAGTLWSTVRGRAAGRRPLSRVLQKWDPVSQDSRLRPQRKGIRPSSGLTHRSAGYFRAIAGAPRQVLPNDNPTELRPILQPKQHRHDH